MIERPHYLTERREFLGSLIGRLGDMPRRLDDPEWQLTPYPTRPTGRHQSGIDTRLRAMVVGVNRTVEELTAVGELHEFLGSA
jgi:hypothetical protein